MTQTEEITFANFDKLGRESFALRLTKAIENPIRYVREHMY